MTARCPPSTLYMQWLTSTYPPTVITSPPAPVSNLPLSKKMSSATSAQHGSCAGWMTLVDSCTAQGAETASNAQDGPPRTAGRNGKGNRLGHFWKVTEVELIHLEGYRLLLASAQAPAACTQKWAVIPSIRPPLPAAADRPLPPPTKTLMKHSMQGGTSARLRHCALTHRTDCTDCPPRVAKKSPEHAVGEVHQPCELGFLSVARASSSRNPALWVWFGGIHASGFTGAEILNSRVCNCRESRVKAGFCRSCFSTPFNTEAARWAKKT